MKRKTHLFAFLLIALFAITLGTPALADCGPKPELTIYVENAPEESYYLDLLADDGIRYDNLGSLAKTYEPEKLKILQNFSEDGWRPALAYGTGVPLFGDLTGTPTDGHMVHWFGYVGLPSTYKIIVVTPENEVRVSEVFEKRLYQETVYYDYEAMQLRVQNMQGKLSTYVIHFAETFLPTLFIEGLLLLAFGFSLAKNWRVFLLVNLGTQIFLTLCVGGALRPEMDVHMVTFVALPLLEIVIMGIEALIYWTLLKGQSKKRVVAYGITANMVSYIASAVLIFVYPW